MQIQRQDYTVGILAGYQLVYLTEEKIRFISALMWLAVDVCLRYASAKKIYMNLC